MSKNNVKKQVVLPVFTKNSHLFLANYSLIAVKTTGKTVTRPPEKGDRSLTLPWLSFLPNFSCCP